MTEKEKNRLAAILYHLDICISKQTQKLSQMEDISLSCWFLQTRLWFMCNRVDIAVKSEYARALLDVPVNLSAANEEQIKLYMTVCKNMKKLNGFGDYGSTGMRF